MLLAEARKVDPDVTLTELTAARLAASEHGRGSPTEWACIIDAEINRAARKGKTLTEHLTLNGLYGPQGRGRPAATRRNPNRQHLIAARAVISGSARGIARGAQRFYDPQAQTNLHRKFKRGLTPGRVFTCDGPGVLEAWSFDLPNCSSNPRRRCCSDGRPKKGAKPGRSTEAWVGEIPNVNPRRLLLMKPLPLGDEHTKAFNAAKARIAGGGLPAIVASSTPAQLLALLALGVVLR